jgi:energy-coupling factor transporter ATP-binding protein EcfA2
MENYTKIFMSLANLPGGEIVAKVLKKNTQTSRIAKKFSREKKRGQKTPVLKRLNIESIEIQNFKSIEKLVVKFPQTTSKNESWLMLLGENGVGKSSFLQAVALTIMGPAYLKTLNIKGRDIYRRNAKKNGFVRINQTGATPIVLNFNSRMIQHSFTTVPSNLLAYGSTRLFSSKNMRPEFSRTSVKAKNLFLPGTALFSDEWLVGLATKKKKLFDFACRALKDLLIKELEDGGIRISVIKKEVWIHFSDNKRPSERLRELSDGYKSIIALACDMMQSLLKDQSTMETAEGIVLLDEIGTHLHPRWKMRVVNSFRNAFPRLQFIVTTHDPLCLKGLRKGEVAVFAKDEAGKIFASTNLPDPSELTAEQLLSSKFFGLLSTLDEELNNDFDEYYLLLSKRENITLRKSKRREKLKTLLKDRRHLGETLREELALTAADRILSEEYINPSNKTVAELQSETLELLKSLWNKPPDKKQVHEETGSKQNK